MVATCKKMNFINGEALSLFHELLLLLINGVFWGIVFVGIACLSKMIKKSKEILDELLKGISF
jgi:hypothetical protein